MVGRLTWNFIYVTQGSAAIHMLSCLRLGTSTLRRAWSSHSLRLSARGFNSRVSTAEAEVARIIFKCTQRDKERAVAHRDGSAAHTEQSQRARKSAARDRALASMPQDQRQVMYAKLSPVAQTALMAIVQKIDPPAALTLAKLADLPTKRNQASETPEPERGSGRGIQGEHPGWNQLCPAADSIPGVNIAAHQVAAPAEADSSSGKREMRYDGDDGPFEMHEFIDYYGKVDGAKKWDRARRWHQSRPAAARSNRVKPKRNQASETPEPERGSGRGIQGEHPGWNPAADSIPGVNIAAHQVAAPAEADSSSGKREMRYDGDDGPFEMHEFIDYYGKVDGAKKWDRARRWHQSRPATARANRVKPKRANVVSPSALTTMWSQLGKSGAKTIKWLSLHPDALTSLVEHTLQKMSSFKAHHLSVIAHAQVVIFSADYQTPEHTHKLWKALEERALVVMCDTDKPIVISSTAWAFANAGRTTPQLFDTLAVVAAPHLANFNVLELSKTAWAFATAKSHAPELFDALAVQTLPKLAELQPTEVYKMAWSFATANHQDHELFAAMTAKAKEKSCMPRMSPQELANFAWACAVVDARNEEVLGATSLLGEICVEKFERFTPPALFQLHQWLLWHKESGVPSVLPLEMREHCFNTFVEQKATESLLQREVMQVLASLDISAALDEEVQTDSGYRLDGLLTLHSGQQVAVEVDGPSHFKSGSQELTGNTALKRRQLASIDDCHIVSLPYWELNEFMRGWHLDKGSDKFAAYLRHKVCGPSING